MSKIYFDDSWEKIAEESRIKNDIYPNNVFRAVKDGNIDKLASIVDYDGWELSCLENDNSDTPLIIAARSNDLEMCKFLVNEMRVDVCYQNKKYGRTALVEMIQSRSSRVSLRIIELLRKSVNYQDCSGKTALMFASQGAGLFGSNKGNTKIINKLLNLNANLFIEDNRGRTALGWAHICNERSKTNANEEVVDLLMDEMLKARAVEVFKTNFKYDFTSEGRLKHKQL